MRLISSSFALSLCALLATGCGQSTFGGGSSNGGGGSPNAGKLSEDDKSKSDEIDLPENPSKEQDAIGKCLKAWGSGNPFGAAAFTDYRKISASVNVLGGGGYAIEDTEVTQGPKLILVKASVSVLGQSNYLLLNPNGWYCFMVDVNVMTKTTVDLQCSAKLADSRVAVNVMSKTSNTAAVGVNVLSEVKVNRIKNEAKASCQ